MTTLPIKDDMSTKYCDSCKGTKQIMGLGMIIHDCLDCDGLGHVKIEDDHDYKNQVKKGRPKLVTNNTTNLDSQ